MAREIKSVIELTRAQTREFLASFYNPDNIKASREENKRIKKLHFNVL